MPTSFSNHCKLKQLHLLDYAFEVCEDYKNWLKEENEKYIPRGEHFDAN